MGEVSPPPPELLLKPDGDEAPDDGIQGEAPAPPPPPPRREAKEAKASAPPKAPPAPSQTKSAAFVHDGFYLRFALGPALSATSLRTDRVASPDVSLTGFGGALDAWLGWTVASGVVLGPSLSGASHQSSAARLGETKGQIDAARTLFGIFLDAYPNPQRGFHFGGILALANLQLSGKDGGNFSSFSGGGLGLEVFGGYEIFIARDWSAGGMVRLGGVFVRDEESFGTNDQVTRQATSFSAALLATLVYH
ncbi:MAG TPA: hypothetical protein VFQ61_37805 [Polyangiaceae bacterium]|nr:hypothetical protein [Polyangiaceae bacterium]